MAAKKTTIKKTVKPRSKRFPKPGPFDAQKILLLPEVVSFDDLFSSVKVRHNVDPALKERRVKIGAGPLQTTGFCQVDVAGSNKYFDCLTIQPTKTLAEALTGSLIYIEYDTINFEVIVYDDRSSRVYAKYNQIIGSRCIAAFDAKETRAFFRKLSKEYGYSALPRAKKAS